MRRIITYISCLVVIGALVLTVSAAGSASISLSADKTSLSAGQTVTVTVSASVDSCGSGGIELSYDKSVFSLLNGEWLLSGTFMTDFSNVSADGVFAFEKGTRISGKAFRFALKVKDGAEIGNSTVTVSMKADKLSTSKVLDISVACSHTYSNSCDSSCNRCGAGREVAHNWNSGKITENPTCTATGIRLLTCTICGTEKKETVGKAEHSYDNSCDTSCNVCGGLRQINHSWDAGKVLDQPTCTNTGSRRLTCKVCGTQEVETMAKAAHQYDNGCDIKCNVCGASRSITHDYVWNCSETEHWRQCSVCSDKIEQGEHTLADTISAQEGQHGHLCSVCGLMPDAKPHTYDNDCDPDCADCGFTRTITHSYSERWEFDAGGHWHACSICGDRLEKNIHTPGEKATETTDQICTTCGLVIETAGNHEHKMAGDWLSDDKGHWFLCFCNAYTVPADHTWDEGVLDEEAGVITYRCTECGHVKNELYIPEPTEPAPEPTYVVVLRRAIPVGLAVSLILNVVLTVCLIVSKRRKKIKEDIFTL